MDFILVMVGILKGSFMFLSDLARRTTIPLEIEFMSVSSYGAATESSGVVRILKDLDTDIVGKHVLLVEDIIDTGNTLTYLMDYLKGRGAASVEIMCLLDKPARRTKELSVKYVGFQIPDAFIIGYGIDYAEKYRNLPYVATLREAIYRSTN
ncbi:Hypoxanthine-guanine phosphoribosyltransferase [Clostridiaceae bacterium JG1575]|nr:Hypoxanthine-guanine phosphoribosyltransferase [Clostridiaceae bacterium JG1575]